MRVLHCCLSNFYIDDYGYQENILTRTHKALGHDVHILASTETYVGNQKIGYVKPSSYLSSDGIPVTRIAYAKYLPLSIVKKLRIYKGLKDELERISPNVIFLHNCFFLDVISVVSYVKKHPHVRVFADSHSDFINSGRNFISKQILHRIIYKWCLKYIEPYVERFYGTLPLRTKLLVDFYGAPPEKTSYLPMGVDDVNIDFSRRDRVRESVRKELGFVSQDFVVVSGGKIDERKNIHILLKALLAPEFKQVRLILFGKIPQGMESVVQPLLKELGKRVCYIGWIPAKDAYKYFWAADLGFFPGTHSTLWEEAIGCGLPCAFKKWDGIQHVDCGGNCVMLDEINTSTISDVLSHYLNNQSAFEKMRACARDIKTTERFSYKKIAELAIS